MDKLKNLREEVFQANLELVERNLVTYTWGNVSQVDREIGIVAIKPSGVDYDSMTPDDIVLLNLECGSNVYDTSLHPSLDTPIHLALYRAFPEIGGITHTHSRCATSFAQAMREVTCFGTTHADYFHGDIPVTRKLSPEEIADEYELNTGKVIIECLKQLDGDALSMSAVLVAQHGPFTWGANATKSVEASVVLEIIAEMAMQTIVLNPDKEAIEQELLDKHYLRKHGKNAYYGQ
jgi:L-ribulose-5-phosphate 4-epimerase